MRRLKLFSIAFLLSVLAVPAFGAEPMTASQAEHERQQCLPGAVQTMGQSIGTRYCDCLRDELYARYSLQKWLTLNAEATRILKAGGNGDDIGRQLPEVRELARTCRARAGLT